jgi:hypothetical protein
MAAGLALVASVALGQSPAEAVVQQLRQQGYVEFAVSRTLLGRVRVVATARDGSQREIVFNPATGEILRDYSEAADGDTVPRILSRPEAEDEPRAASSPPEDASGGATPQQDGDDGNHGHGNDAGGFDSDNPGQGHGNDGTPGGGNPNPGNGGNGNPPRGGGNGKG